MTPPKNVSSWRLNKQEQEELHSRVAKGEDEATVKRELQTLKAQKNEDRKASASAVAQRCQLQGQQMQAQAKRKAATGKAAAKALAAGQVAPGPSPNDPALLDAANKAYYCQVQSDIQAILSEFGGEAFRQEKPLPITGAGVGSGVQEPFERSKASQAMSAHGLYRCSVSIFWLNPLHSATPGIPLSRKRVEDLTQFYYGTEGLPRHHSERMVEVGVSKTDLNTDTPSNLQIIGPEELVHATLAGCARAIQFLSAIA